MSNIIFNIKRLKGGAANMECHGNRNCSGVYFSLDEPRRFFTKEERIKMLQEYKETLENEAKGVGEKIAELE